MPNKYEREIEEILRNLEQTEPKASRGPRAAGRPRPRLERRMHIPQQRRFPTLSLHFGAAEWFLIICIIGALIGGGFAYTLGPSIFTGFVALLSVGCFFVVLLMPFVARTGSRYSTQSTRYGNVTPLRRSRNPLRALSTRWHLFMLKVRYRRKRDT